MLTSFHKCCWLGSQKMSIIKRIFFETVHIDCNDHRAVQGEHNIKGTFYSSFIHKSYNNGKWMVRT